MTVVAEKLKILPNDEHICNIIYALVSLLLNFVHLYKVYCLFLTQQCATHIKTPFKLQHIHHVYIMIKHMLLSAQRGYTMNENLTWVENYSNLTHPEC